MDDERVIDWQQLAIRFDALHLVDERKAQLALAEIVGDDALRAAVDWYVDGKAGAELVRLTLWQLRPRAARDRCVEIWRSSDSPERRVTAIELLRAVATGEDLALIEELLSDPVEGVQVWGIGVLDQLLWSDLVEPEEAEALLASAATHSNEAVREQCEFIRSYLRKRQA